MSITAGWFPDPGGSADTFRWWDGQRWTRWLSLDRRATPPGPEPVDAPTPRTTGTVPPDPADARAVRIGVAVALVVGVVLVALLVVGATVVLTEDRIRSGPAVPPPSAPVAEEISYDPATRTVRLENVKLVLPAAPYVCADRTQPLAPALNSALSCQTLVHADYAGGQDWYASMGFGVLEDDQVVARDPEQTAKKLFTTFRAEFFAGTRTTVEKLAPLEHGLVPSDKGFVLAGEVHYAVKGLSSRFDRMVVAVLTLPDGRFAAFFTARPNDLAPATLAVLNASFVTLSAQ